MAVYNPTFGQIKETTDNVKNFKCSSELKIDGQLSFFLHENLSLVRIVCTLEN